MLKRVGNEECGERGRTDAFFPMRSLDFEVMQTDKRLSVFHSFWQPGGWAQTEGPSPILFIKQNGPEVGEQSEA